MKKHTYINGNGSFSKATGPTNTNLNLGVTLERNDVYEITIDDDYNKQYHLAYLYNPLCECHFEEVAGRPESRAKRLCECLKGGLYIGANPKRGDDLYEYNPSYFRKLARDRKLFLEFLNRYVAGEFKYKFPLFAQPMDFNELLSEQQRSIKLLTDTISEICKPKRRRKINN